MRIGIDARMMGKGFGLARYVEQLILHLLEIDQKNEYVLFLRKENFDTVFEYKNVTKILADIPWYSFKEQLTFSHVIKKQKVDLMHFPHWNVPYFCKGPFVVTIHDLIMFHYPRPAATTLGPVKFFIKDLAHRLLLHKIGKQAKYIIATSEYTKKDIHETLYVPLEKITVTYQAPFVTRQHLPQLNDDSILSNYHITKPYVLYVGAAYPHKNLQRLLEAWKLYEKKYGSSYQLVLVGKEDSFYKRIKTVSESLFSSLNSPIFTGFVPDEKLNILYQHSALYIFPSLYEGFGLPPLEAMVQGVPVLSSNRSCLPEVLGNAALYFDPEKSDEIVESLQQALMNESLRRSLEAPAEQILQKYSWHTLAQQTLNIYKQK